MRFSEWHSVNWKRSVHDLDKLVYEDNMFKSIPWPRETPPGREMLFSF